MTEQRVVFKNSKCQKLVGILSIPADIESISPCPAVIVAHGFKGSKDQPHIKACAEGLCSSGIVALRFDSSNGIGDSDGDIFDCDLTGYLDDFKCALDFLETISYVDGGRLGLTGHSFGGQTTLITAATDSRVKAIVPQCATFLPSFSDSLQHSEHWKENGYKIFESSSTGQKYKVGYHFVEDRLQYPDDRMRELVSRISIPTRIIHSEKDESVPLHTAHKLFETLSCEKDIHIIAGAPHTYKQPEQLEEVTFLVVGWFEKHLK